MPEVTLSAWNAFLDSYPEAHLLQTGEWGELKSAFGWTTLRLVHGEVGAQILFRRLPLGMSLAYLPKGPVGAIFPPPSHPFWREVEQCCRARRAIFLKMEPDAWEEDTPPLLPGWRLSTHQIQPRRTLVVSLSGSEEEILARMRQKCRYNIRLAEKKGVRVHPWDNVDGFYHLMTLTAQRDHFGIHSRAYYQRVYELFHAKGMAELFVAEYAGQPLAALMVFVRGSRAWYFFGASGEMERNRMPTYLLQWEAMRWAKRRGACQYDLWGVPDEDLATLESQFEERTDQLWGVYRFKRGFGGQLRRAAPAWDRVYYPGLYALYLRYVTRRDVG